VALALGLIGVIIFTLRWRRAQTVQATVQVVNHSNLPTLVWVHIPTDPRWSHRWLSAPPTRISGAAPAPSPTSSSSHRAPSSAVSSAQSGVQRALGLAHMIGNLADAIAEVLPDPLGKPFKRIALQSRQQVYQVQQVRDRPRQILRDVKVVREAGGQLAQQAPSSLGARASSAPQPSATDTPPPMASTMRQTAAPGWVLQPGERRDLRLAIWPRQPFRFTRTPFNVTLTYHPADETLAQQAVFESSEQTWTSEIALGYRSLGRRLAPLWMTGAVAGLALILWGLSRLIGRV